MVGFWQIDVVPTPLAKAGAHQSESGAAHASAVTVARRPRAGNAASGMPSDVVFGTVSSSPCRSTASCWKAQHVSALHSRSLNFGQNCGAHLPQSNEPPAANWRDWVGLQPASVTVSSLLWLRFELRRCLMGVSSVAVPGATGASHSRVSSAEISAALVMAFQYGNFDWQSERKNSSFSTSACCKQLSRPLITS